MKRESSLINRIASFENLQIAYYKAKRRKEARPEIWEYSKNLKTNLQLLQAQIANGSVEVGNYHYFTIFDPKERQICAATFHERVLHHAIMNVCHQVFESHQIAHSYATRPNKGTFMAVDKAFGFQHRYKYYLKLDIRKYFDSISHHVLLQQLSRKFKDPVVLSIFSKIIYSYQVSEGRGVPIGNLTSQYFANHYLSGFDHFVKEILKAEAYIRYMDDFVIWHNDIQQLNKIRAEITTYLEEKLQLKLKTSFINTTEHGLTFLGFRLFPHKKLLSLRSKKRFETKLDFLNQQLNEQEISQEEFAQRATALFSFVQKAYTKKFRKKVLAKCEYAE